MNDQPAPRTPNIGMIVVGLVLLLLLLYPSVLPDGVREYLAAVFR